MLIPAEASQLVTTDIAIYSKRRAHLSTSCIKKDAFELYHMKKLRFMLNTIGQWPNELFGVRTRRTRMFVAYHYGLITLASILQISAIAYLKLNIANIPFIDAGSCVSNVMLTFLFIQRSTLPFQKKFKDVVKKFVLEFNLIHHEHMNDFAKKETQWVTKICNIASRILHLEPWLGLTTFNLTPLFINIRAGMFSENRPENKTFMHSIEFIVPFDCRTDTIGYWFMFAWNFYPSYYVPAAMCFYDLLMFIMLFHISGHLNILSHNLRSFPRQSGNPNKPSSQEYNDQVFALLKGVIRHYQCIKEFMSEMSNTFDMTLGGYLVFQQVMCCLLLLEISTLDRDAIGRYGILTLCVFQQLIQTSVIFEFISSKSDKLGDKVYELPWEDMNVKNRKIVLLFLRSVQKPLGLKVGGMVPVGVLTMSSILRNSFSYYLMLKTLS